MRAQDPSEGNSPETGTTLGDAMDLDNMGARTYV
jgi:hypothetical protein